MRQKRGRIHNAKKSMHDGIEFDSMDEKDYYIYLLGVEDVAAIELQPKYTIINSYITRCKRCKGVGRLLNDVTGNLNQCSLCKGKGKRAKSGAIYTADFKVTYEDGYTESIDVKGGPVERDFSLRKKLFELQTGQELIVTRRKGRGWIRE